VKHLPLSLSLPGLLMPNRTEQLIITSSVLGSRRSAPTSRSPSCIWLDQNSEQLRNVQGPSESTAVLSWRTPCCGHGTNLNNTVEKVSHAPFHCFEDQTVQNLYTQGSSNVMYCTFYCYPYMQPSSQSCFCATKFEVHVSPKGKDTHETLLVSIPDSDFWVKLASQARGCPRCVEQSGKRTKPEKTDA
jgi:hypothetical protein